MSRMTKKNSKGALTNRQFQVLSAIQYLTAMNPKKAPTMKEIGDVVGISLWAVNRILHQVEAEWLVPRDPKSHRALRLAKRLPARAVA